MDNGKMMQNGIGTVTDQFTTDQKKEIALGIAEKIDTSIYAKPAFTAIQMRQIRIALKDGIDVSSFADPKYDWMQMDELRKGVEAGLDTKIYRDPSIDYFKMRQIRICLQDGVKIDAYLGLNADIIRQIRLASNAKVNIVPYIKEGYDAAQLEQIRLAQEHKVDINPFLSKEYRGISLEEIRIGLEKGLNVFSYARLCYNWRQMRELRLGLEMNIDISKYSNPLYSYRQMREIRKGLQSGLPVDDYSKMRFSATDMREKRRKLLEEMKKVENNLQSSQQMQSLLKENEKEAEREPLQVVISPDEMEVHLLINNRDGQLTENDILHDLWVSGVRKGILRKEIEKVVDGIYQEKSVLVAVGQAPRAGKDGWYEFFFRTDVSRAPKVLEDGSVDYQNIDWFDTVKAGEKLAIYHPAEDGVDGFTVRGAKLPSIKGREQRVLTGKGFKYDRESRTYYSMVNGWIEFNNNYLEVSNMMAVDEVNMASGNLVYDGNVQVKGDVGGRVEIRASGDVIVDGFVEDAVIECGGSVILKKGMNAKGNGRIVAGKDVSGKFLESVKVYAGGSIKIDYCLNSELEAENKVEVSKYTGTLLGGKIEAARGIDAQNVGNASGKRTLLKVGISKRLLEKDKEIKRQLESAREELTILENAKRDLESKYLQEELGTMEIYSKYEDAIYSENNKIEELNLQKKENEEAINLAKTAKVVIHGKVYEGVSVDVNGKHWNSKYMTNITIQGTMDDQLSVSLNGYR